MHAHTCTAHMWGRDDDVVNHRGLSPVTYAHMRIRGAIALVIILIILRILFNGAFTAFDDALTAAFRRTEWTLKQPTLRASPSSISVPIPAQTVSSSRAVTTPR